MSKKARECLLCFRIENVIRKTSKKGKEEKKGKNKKKIIKKIIKK